MRGGFSHFENNITTLLLTDSTPVPLKLSSLSGTINQEFCPREF